MSVKSKAVEIAAMASGQAISNKLQEMRNQRTQEPVKPQEQQQKTQGHQPQDRQPQGHQQQHQHTQPNNQPTQHHQQRKGNELLIKVNKAGRSNTTKLIIVFYVFVLWIAAFFWFFSSLIPGWFPFKNEVFSAVFNIIGYLSLLPIIVLIWAWVTQPPGSAIPVLLLAGVFLAINAESYYLTLNSAHIPFTPKLFIDDGVDVKQLSDPKFWSSIYLWIALIFAVSVQAFQSSFFRFLAQGKQAIKKGQAAKRAATFQGLAVALSYGFDIGTAFMSYPIIGKGLFEIVINLVYAIITIAGAETAYNLFLKLKDESHSDSDRTMTLEV